MTPYEQKLSINQLKAMRFNAKKKRNEASQALIKHLSQLIKAKQYEYFVHYQYIKGFRWSMLGNRRRR